MSGYGESFISKVLDTGDVHAFDRYLIDHYVLQTEAEQKAYEFIVQYAEDNNGEVPDFSTVEAEIEGFTYIPQVVDTFKFLAEQLKDYAGKRAVNDFWNSEDVARLFRESESDEFIDEAIKKLEYIKHRTQKGGTFAYDLKKDVEKFEAEYERRREGKSFTIWQSRFEGVNEAIGGYLSGNTYAWYGRSGRGKSIISAIELIASAMQGATVLIWSLEMGWFELAVRFISSLAAYVGLLELETDTGEILDAGFSTRELLTGKLDEDMTAQLSDFLRKLNDIVPGEIIIRSVDDPNFSRRDSRQLEADIKQTDADVVMVDPIYYMQMEKNTSKTAGGDVAKTSQKLRHIAGKHSVVMHIVTQADEVNDDEDEHGDRTLRLPKRAEVTKAKQILHDAAALIGIDTHDGRGKIGIGKGRTGGEDIEVELQFMPDYGIIRELMPLSIDDIDLGDPNDF